MIEDDEIQMIVDMVEARMMKKIYNMLYAWSMFVVESGDEFGGASSPSFEEAIRD